MSAHIYIIRDGDQTKIGMSTNLERRLPAYKTHNPNYELVKTYPCQESDARRIELVIKQAFKDRLTGHGKEWFSVPAEEIDRFVRSLLEASASVSDAMPSLHGVSLTDEAERLLDEIHKAVIKGENSLPLKERFADVFCKAFGLGVPLHRLPDNVLFREYLSVDLDHSAEPTSKLVRDAAANGPSFPYSDHCWHFFHLLRLSSGHALAVSTAFVSMPYKEALKGNAEHDLFKYGKELGLWVTFHHDWSWWYPSKTALILWQPKTRIDQMMAKWERSFRKWVIERREVLRFESYEDSIALRRAIDDVCDDKLFPLDFTAYEELREKYLGPFRGIASDEKMADEEWEDDRALAMRFLVEQWRNG